MISVQKVLASVPGSAELTDPVLLALIAGSVAFVQTQTRRYFGERAVVQEYLDGNNSYHLRLSELAHTEDSDDPTITVIERCTPSTAVGPVTEFELRDSENTTFLVRTDGAVWGSGYEYVVTYLRGFAVDQGPKDIEQLLLDLVALRVHLGGAPALRSEQIGGYSYTRFGEGDLDALPGSRDTLAAWRRYVLV